MKIAIAVGAALATAALLTACGGSGTAKPEAAATVTVRPSASSVTVTAPPVTRTVTVKPKVRPSAAPAGPATSMSADGVYVVGVDIQPGTYHTTGASAAGGGQCYVARLSSTNTNDIIDNNITNGPSTISTGQAKAIDVSGCKPWIRIGG
ncbi:MAG TPA: hypothetical protein VMV92_21810 [Streptosporangiaceae bacterium]|nr:hypothetical protein [Streptosporangiaceae bacterium]